MYAQSKLVYVLCTLELTAHVKCAHQHKFIYTAAYTHAHTHVDVAEHRSPKRQDSIKAVKPVKSGCVVDQCVHRSERVH